MIVDEKRVTDPGALALVRAAIADIMLRLPLIGLTYHGRAILVIERLDIETMCTDGRHVWYSPKWVRSQALEWNVFDLVHEWLHVFGNDVRRSAGRVRPVWQTAIDMHVVREASVLLKHPWPKNGVIPAPWSGDLSKEAIYERLLKIREDAQRKRKEEQEKAAAEAAASPLPPAPTPAPTPGANADEDENEGGDDITSGPVPEHLGGDLELDSPHEPEEDAHDAAEFYQQFSDDLQQAVTAIHQVTKKSIKDLYGPGIESRLQTITRGTLPWGRLVRGRLLDQLGGQTESWHPPKLKYWPHAVLPNFRSLREPVLVIGIDVSASVSQHYLNEFIANVAPAAARAKKVVVVVFDSKVREVHITKRPSLIMRDIKFLMGDHNYTDASGVFDIADEHKASAIVVETDGHVRLPTREYPETTWILNPGSQVKMPWGQTHVMEASW